MYGARLQESEPSDSHHGQASSFGQRRLPLVSRCKFANPQMKSGSYVNGIQGAAKGR